MAGDFITLLSDETFWDYRTLVAGLTFLAVLAALLSLAPKPSRQARLDARLKRLKDGDARLRRQMRDAQVSRAGGTRTRALRPQAEGSLQWIVERFSLRQLMASEQTRTWLGRAGFRGPRPLVVFLVCRFTGSILLTLLALFFVDGLSLVMALSGLLAAFAIGYYAPAIWVENQIANRMQSIEFAFPDALDLLLICVNAGMSIEAAFHKVSGEMGTQSLPLAEEMMLTTAELSYLPDRATAFGNFADRTGFAGTRALASTLTQTERYGTPVTQALRVLADENRTARLHKAERKAAALPATLAVPVVAFFLPALFVVIIGPAVLRFFS